MKRGRPCTNTFSLDTLMRYVAVQKSGACWLWFGAQDRAGYGLMTLAGKTVKVHRMSFQLHYGWAPRAHVCHRCDTPACVNPLHLFEGTDLDNHLDAVRKGRKQEHYPPPRARKKETVERRGPTKGMGYRNVLTDDQVRQIRKHPGGGTTVAREFGVSEVTIWKVRKGLVKQFVLD